MPSRRVLSMTHFADLIEFLAPARERSPYRAQASGPASSSASSRRHRSNPARSDELVHADADEHQLLPAIAEWLLPVAPELRERIGIGGPFRLGAAPHQYPACPVRHAAPACDQEPTSPIREAAKKKSLRARSRARPLAREESLDALGVEGAASSIHEARDAVLLGLRRVDPGELLCPARGGRCLVGIEEAGVHDGVERDSAVLRGRDARAGVQASESLEPAEVRRRRARSRFRHDEHVRRTRPAFDEQITIVPFVLGAEQRDAPRAPGSRRDGPYSRRRKLAASTAVVTRVSVVATSARLNPCSSSIKETS